MSDNTGHWSRIATSWFLVGPPLRPSPEDVAVFERVIQSWSDSALKPPRALILGVTPELFKLGWPAGTQLRALDGSIEMIKAIWPGTATSALVGSWTSTPFADASQDIIVCDGGFGMLGYPDTQRTLLAEIRRMLVPGGIFAVRLFAPSGRTGSLAEISADLNAGLITSLDALKLRLWGALQTDTATGVCPRDVVAEIEKMAGGLEHLVTELGWSAAHVATLQLHRNSNAVYHLTKADELADMAGEISGLEVLSVQIPDHSFGACCPVVTLQRH